MLVYYQDFGSTSNYRIQNYAESLAVLTDRLHSGLFPAYAPVRRTPPPPPPGCAPPLAGLTPEPKRARIALPPARAGTAGATRRRDARFHRVDRFQRGDARVAGQVEVRGRRR